jgi:ATP phosphoribosyltransferase
MIRLAVQKSGRLQEGSLNLLKESGLQFSNGKDQLKAGANNFPIELLFLRDDDIPQYVEDGVADAGIVGENIFLEKQKEGDVIKRLGFARCRLSVAVPKNETYTGVQWLNGKNIATSYPNLVKKFLQSKNIHAGIHEISGSVEIAPGIGLADAICDLVSSGSTLLSNGLKEAETILQSEAILIAHKNLSQEKKDLLNQLVFRFEAVQKAQRNKYILLNCPNEAIDAITRVLPGVKSPTVLPLATPGWSSLHSVVDEDDFWSKIHQLKKLGAQGILVIPIEKMIV